jgi:hypothetical protein
MKRSFPQRVALLDSAFCEALRACKMADSPDDALAWANVAAAVLAIDNGLDDTNFGHERTAERCMAQSGDP